MLLQPRPPCNRHYDDEGGIEDLGLEVGQHYSQTLIFGVFFESTPLEGRSLAGSHDRGNTRGWNTIFPRPSGVDVVGVISADPFQVRVEVAGEDQAGEEETDGHFADWRTTCSTKPAKATVIEMASRVSIGLQG